MPAAIVILFGATFTVAVMTALGSLLLRALKLQFHRQEQPFFAFMAGAACLSFIVFLLASVHCATGSVFFGLGLAALTAAFGLRTWRSSGERLPPMPRLRSLFFWALFALFTYLYFFNAMAPVISSDGAAYHLGFVSRYAAEHGFYRVTTDMYAHLSQGAELLFLFAYVFGRHSAASLVHFSFLVALPLGMLCYARRFGFTNAGIAGALLVYMCPVVGFDGSTAYIDVAVACALFAIFYLLQIWDTDRRTELLILIGLLAGFSYALKYTAFVAVPYAAGFVAWKTFRKGRSVARPVAIVAVCALLMMAPWVLRNWIWYGNPLSPFYNSWFPNPYTHIGLEQDYREQLAHWGGVTNILDIPLEATVRGDRLQGLLGPVFLLAPIALAALRYRQGRQLLLAAAVFLATYPSNIGTRFLIPCLPFLSLAMGMALANWKAMAPLVLVAHAWIAWPSHLTEVFGRSALWLRDVPVEAALRIEPEERYLRRCLYGYSIARMVEEKVPPGAQVFCKQTPPQAYTSRDILGPFHAALNNNLLIMLDATEDAGRQPVRRLTFRFPARRLRCVRVVQTARKGLWPYWSISEFRVYGGSRELPRDRRWRTDAHPNPFEAEMAFDGNPMTSWRSWEPLATGEYVEADFGRTEEIDSVVLDTAPDQPAVKLVLEGRAASGPWSVLATGARESTIPGPASMRRMVTQEFRRQGIGYLLIGDSDRVARDLRANTAQWGVTFEGENKGERLYRIE